MSGSEMLLFGYGAVCVCMLLFNIVYIFVQKGNDRRLEKRSLRHTKEIAAELDRLRDGGTVDPRYIRRLQKKLARVNSLVALERAVSDPQVQEDACFAAFAEALCPAFATLARAYKKREDIEAAYFLFFLSRHKAFVAADSSAVQEILLEYIQKNSLYCRVNAMTALYAFGTAESVARAVDLMSRMGSTFNEKILTDGLLTFSGDHAQLIAALRACFDGLTVRFRLAVMNYIRYKTGAYCEWMYGVMLDETADKELRLAAVRYFGRYSYEPARAVLLDFLANKDGGDWEYAAISATCLASYSGDDVVAALMEAMHSSNWYVRRNASQSLERYNLDYNDLIEIVGGRDRYAREMMMYRLDVKRLEQERIRRQEEAAV